MSSGNDFETVADATNIFFGLCYHFNVKIKGSAPLLYSWGRLIPENGGTASPAFPKCNKNTWAQ